MNSNRKIFDDLPLKELKIIIILYESIRIYLDEFVTSFWYLILNIEIWDWDWLSNFEFVINIQECIKSYH